MKEIRFKIPNVTKYYYNLIYLIKALFYKIKKHKEIKRNLKYLNLYEFSSKKLEHIENLYPEYKEFRIQKKKLFIYHFIINAIEKPLFKMIYIPIFKIKFFFSYNEKTLLDYIAFKCNIKLLNNTMIILSSHEKTQIIPHQIKYNDVECSITINEKYTIYLKRYLTQINKIFNFIIDYFDLKTIRKP